MFAWFSTLALILPLVSALTVETPTNWENGETVTLTWTGQTTDPMNFSVLLVNTQFHNTFAIANNVPTVDGQISFSLPEVPVTDGYTIEFIANNDVNTIYATSGSFSIGAMSSTSATAGSTTSTASMTGSSTMSTGTLSTPSATATTPASSSSAAAATTGTSSAASTTPTNLSGAASFKLGGVVPAAALVLSAVVGAVMVF